MSVKTSFSFVASFSSRTFGGCTLQCCEAPSGPAERQDGLLDTARSWNGWMMQWPSDFFQMVSGVVVQVSAWNKRLKG